MNTSKCVICSKKLSVNIYCKFHAAAFEKIHEAYPKWRSAFGEMSWERYLESITKLEESGIWAKEVASFELRSGRNHT